MSDFFARMLPIQSCLWVAVIVVYSIVNMGYMDAESDKTEICVLKATI